MADDTQTPEVQDPPSKAIKLYNNLLNDGYTAKNLGSQDDFASALSDPGKAAKIYNNLLGDGYTVKNLGGMDDFLNTFTSSHRPDTQTGFSVNPNLGAPRQPLSVNLHPDQPQQPQQQEAPSIDNNFGINHNQLAAVQQPQSDNTANVAPLQTEGKVDFDVNHAQRQQEQQDYTNKAVDNATAKALKIKGINAQPGSVQYNQQRNEFVNQVKNGDAAVNTKNGEAGLERTTGFWHNIASGFNEATTGADEANDFANKMTTQQMVDYANRKQSQQPSPYIGERPNLLGSAGHFLGSSTPLLAKAGAGAIIGAGAVAAAPESMGASLAGLPTAMSFMLTAPDMVNQGVQQEVLRRYQILKHEHPEISDVDNMEEAKKGALAGGVGGILENAALMGEGMKIPIMADSKNLLGQTVNHIVNSGVHLGTVSAGLTGAEQELGNLQGVKTSQSDILKNSLESFKEGATTGALLAAYMHVPEMPKILKSVFKDAILRNSDPQTVANVLQANENVGNIPQGTTQAVTTDLKGYSDALNKIPDGLSPEAQSSIAGLIQKKNNLIAESKTKDDSFKDFYQNQIDPINQQISDIQRTGKPFEHEIDEATGKPYEQPTYDDVAKQNVQDLAKKISKNADISDPHSIQTEQNFPDQLKAELQNIADTERKNNEGKENPNTEVADNSERYIKENFSNPQADPSQSEVQADVPRATSNNNVTKEAQDLLDGLKSGSKPTFITKNLEKIANDNGIEVTGKMSADDVINALKEKRNEPTTPEVNKPIPVNEGEGQDLKNEDKLATALDSRPQTYKLVNEIDEPTDARGIALSYFAGGGKVDNGEMKNEFTGNKDTRFRAGKNNKTADTKGNTMFEPNGRTVTEVAHSLWDSLPEHLHSNITDHDIKNELLNVMSSHESRFDAAKEYVSKYHPDYVEAAKNKTEREQFADEEEKYKKEIADEEKGLNSLLEDQAKQEEEIKSSPEYIQQLIKQYESERTEPNATGDNAGSKEESNPSLSPRSGNSESERLKQAQSDHDRATSDLSKAEKKLAEKQSKQGDLLNPEKNIVQQDAFANDADVVKDALKPLRDKVKETKAALDKAKNDAELANNAQPELKLSKSEERVFKEGIKKSDAQKIINDEGLTADNIDNYKHLFNGFPYTPEDFKNIKDEIKRPSTESTAARQPYTGGVGDQKTGNEAAEAKPEIEHSGASAEVPEPITEGETGRTGSSEQGTSASKIAFARSNSYDAYKILHPDETVEDYNKLRNSDVEIPTGDLRKLSKEYAKQKSQEAFNSRVDGIADKIISKISFKGAEGATKAGIGDEEIIRTAAKIIKAAYSAKENIREAVEKAIDYIKQHLFVDKESEDNIRDQFNGVAAQFEKARHLTKVIDMVRDGKTDEQIMDHLSRKGVPRESALAILGDAKTNQVTPEEKAEALDQATKKYNKIEDEWLGEKSLTLVNSRVRAKDQQDAIKKSNDTTDLKAKIKSILDGEGTAKEKTTAAQKLINALHAAKDWRNIDKAIHIYLDLKRNPDHYEEYYNKLTPQQKAIADLSKNLNPEQLKIADEISKEYDEIGKMATDQGLIKEALDNYVSRAWDFGKNSNESGFKFTTSTRHSLERSLDTILQGQAEGLKLKLEGATNNLQTLKVELGNVIENKKLIDKGFQTKVDTGLKDENGKPITESYFSVEPRKGYAKIENPFFKKWTYIGKAGEGTEANGKNIKVVGDAILEKKDIYAPESAAKSINNILGKSKFDALGFTKFARFVKQSILSLSGFHYIAFTRAHLLSGKFTELKGISPRKAYKDGLSQLHSLSPEAGELIKGGLTIGRQQDWTEGLSAYNIEPKTQLGKMVNQFHKHLFETYGAGLKTFDAVNLYRSELIKNAKREKPLTREQVAANVSKLMNDTYGGENFQKMRGTFLQNPTNRHLLSLGLLAPDWTISNLRQVRNAFVGNSTKMYRNMWFRILTRGAAVTLGANALMTLMDEKDKDGNQLPYWDAFEQRYQKSFDAGRLKSLMVDMTPLYHLAGGDKNQRAYFSIFGAYTDPLKLVNNPVQFLENKLNPASVKIPLEVLTGENWQQKRFTDVDELLGIDDKGTYSKTIHAHKMGDISPTTGKAYVRDQKGHEVGENKGGKLKGQLVKYDDKDHGPVSFEELPSFTLSQVRGMMPTALQSIYQGVSGENDWAKTMFQAPGTGVMFGKEGAQDKEKTLFNLGKKIYDKVTK